MPYHHANRFNERIKRKCDCGGEPEMIMDFVDDFIVRCRRCHVSTHAYMKPEDAIRHWDSGDDVMLSPLDLLIDDLDKNLAGEVLYMAIAEDDVLLLDRQSCDCYQVLIVMRDRILSAEHEENGEGGAIGFDVLSKFNENKYNLRIVPKENSRFAFDSILYNADGTVDGVKYRLGDSFVFLFADEHNLIVTKSMIDLFNENEPVPEHERLALFE